MSTENKYKYTVEFERRVGISAYHIATFTVELPFGKNHKYRDGKSARSAALQLADHYRHMFTAVRVIKWSGYSGVHESMYGFQALPAVMLYRNEIDKATEEEIRHYLDSAVVREVPDDLREYGLTVVQAYRTAATYHLHQTYSNNEPYINHIMAVTRQVMQATAQEANVIEEDEEGHKIKQAIPTEVSRCVAAALLHDIIEDTDYTASEMMLDFDDDLTKTVLFLSVDRKYSDKPRAARTEYMHKLWNRIDKNTELWERVSLVKTADRLCNVRASVAGNSKKLAMYRTEHDAAKSILRNPYTAKMWDEMDMLLAENK